MKLDKYNWVLREEMDMGVTFEDYKRISSYQEDMKKAMKTYKSIKKSINRPKQKQISAHQKALNTQMVRMQKYE